jgi:hypothetical protein
MALVRRQDLAFLVARPAEGVEYTLVAVRGPGYDHVNGRHQQFDHYRCVLHHAGSWLLWAAAITTMNRCMGEFHHRFLGRGHTSTASRGERVPG